MILLGLLVICVMTVPLAGGRIGRLAGLQFGRPWAAVAALALQFGIMRLFPGGDAGVHGALHLVSYGLMFYFLAANLAIPGLWLIGVGGGLNALAIAANDGVMPAHPSALRTAGVIQAPGEFANSAAVADAKLWFLGDVFAVPASWPFANVFSVGDILLVIGAFILLHRVSGSALAPRLEAARLWMVGHSPKVIREHRAFRRLWLAQGISSIGDWVYPIAVYVSLEQTGKGGATHLALLLIAQAGPAMLVSLFGGPLVDRFARKWLMFATDVVRGGAVGSLLLAGGDPTLVHLYAVSVLLGVGGALNQPAFLASLPNILPTRALAAANALVSVTVSLPLVVGPLLGAVIAEHLGTTWGFTANAVSFGFSAALVYGTQMPRHARAAGQSMFRELGVGVRYVRNHRPTLGVLVVMGIVTVAAGIKEPLELPFAYDTLGSGSTGFGLMSAVWGLGMVVGGIFATRMDRRLGHGPLLTLSIAVVSLTVVGGAMAPSLGPVLVLWAVAGVVNTFGTVAYETLLQETTPDAVRGRVMAALEATIRGGLLAGMGAAALTRTVFGGDYVREGLLVSGLLFGAAAVAAWLMLHRSRLTPAGVPEFKLRDLEWIPATPSLSLLRVSGEGPAGPGPVLLVDDGVRVHRLDPLPSPDGGADPKGRFGYGVPQALLALRRPALALEIGGRRLLELPPPSRLRDA